MEAGPLIPVTAGRTDTGILITLSAEDGGDADAPSGERAFGPSGCAQLPFHQLARRSIDRLQLCNAGKPHDVVDICDMAVKELQQLSGFDRVIAGEVEDSRAQVIAEAKLQGQTAFHGMSFPLPTIPDDWLETSKHQPSMNFLYNPLSRQATPADGVLTSETEDRASLLSMVSEQACHLTMVNAHSLLLIPIGSPVKKEGRGRMPIWGYILCYHNTKEWTIPGSRRSACSFFIHALHMQLGTALTRLERSKERSTVALRSLICDRLSFKVPSSVVTEDPSIHDLILCDGAAHVHGLYGSTVSHTADCPPDMEILQILRALQEKSLLKDGFYSQSAKTCSPSSSSDTVSDQCVDCMAVLKISESDFLFWFRKPKTEEVRWVWHQDSPSAGETSSNSTSLCFTPDEIDILQAFQTMAQGALRGHTEPMKTMMLVKLNEERLRAMKDLATVARDLSRLMDVSRTPIMGLARDLTINEWNQSMAELTGFPKFQMLGRSLRELMPISEFEAFEARVEKVVEGNVLGHQEMVLYRSRETCRTDSSLMRTESKGEWALNSYHSPLPTVGENEVGLSFEGSERSSVVLMVSMTPQWDSIHEVIGVSVIGHDITEQKNMIKELKRQSSCQKPEDLRTAINGASLPIWCVDKSGVVVEWNEAMVNMTGIRIESAMGQRLMGQLINCDKMLVVSDNNLLLSLEFAIQRVFAGHKAPSLNFTFINEEGRRIDSNISFQIRKDEKGEPAGVLCFLQDVSMRRAVEKAMAVKIAAEAAADAKVRHLAFLCHEIRNPLNGILGNISFMEDTNLTEEQKELVDTTATCGYQLRKIVEDVLDISKIDEGKIELEWKELNIQRILAAVMSQVGIAAANKGLQLYSTIDPLCHSYIVFGDCSRIQQVISNFAWNAIKFTHVGWAELAVEMKDPEPEVSPDGFQTAKFSFSVSDSGEGIPDTLRRRLFTEFATGKKAANSQYGGTGLGLNICQKLAALMGGEVTCISELGKGSRFSLDLPLQVMPASSKQTLIQQDAEKDKVEGPLESRTSDPNQGKGPSGRNTPKRKATPEEAGIPPPPGSQRPDTRPAPSPSSFTSAAATCPPSEVQSAAGAPSTVPEGEVQRPGPQKVPTGLQAFMPGQPSPLPQTDPSPPIPPAHERRSTICSQKSFECPRAVVPEFRRSDSDTRLQTEQTNLPGACPQSTRSAMEDATHTSSNQPQEHLPPCRNATLPSPSQGREQFPPASSLAGADQLTAAYGSKWGMHAVKEIVTSRSVAVLVEVNIGAISRQAWGCVDCSKHDVPTPILLLPMAMDIALTAASKLFCREAICVRPQPEQTSAPSSPPSGDQTPITAATSAKHRTVAKKVPQVVPVEDCSLGPGQLAPLRLHRFQGNAARPALPTHVLNSNPAPTTPVVPAPIVVASAPVVVAPTPVVEANIVVPSRTLPSDVLPGPIPSGTVTIPKTLVMLDTKEHVESEKSMARPVPEFRRRSKSEGAAIASSSPAKRNSSVDPIELNPKLQVLVVDDEPVNVMVVTRALAREGCFEVTTGSDGVDVVKLIIDQGQRYDGLLLDERLKFMNGSEACLLVRDYEVAQSYPEMVIIAISANVEPSDVKKYAMAGYTAVLGKPINVRCAGKVISKFLRSWQPFTVEARRKIMKSGLYKINRTEDDLLIFTESSSDIPAP